jgi:hypothetical protein
MDNYFSKDICNMINISFGVLLNANGFISGQHVIY